LRCPEALVQDAADGAGTGMAGAHAGLGSRRALRPRSASSSCVLSGHENCGASARSRTRPMTRMTALSAVMPEGSGKPRC